MYKIIHELLPYIFLCLQWWGSTISTTRCRSAVQSNPIAWLWWSLQILTEVTTENHNLGLTYLHVGTTTRSLMNVDHIMWVSKCMTCSYTLNRSRLSLSGLHIDIQVSPKYPFVVYLGKYHPQLWHPQVSVAELHPMVPKINKWCNPKLQNIPIYWENHIASVVQLSCADE